MALRIRQLTRYRRPLQRRGRTGNSGESANSLRRGEIYRQRDEFISYCETCSRPIAFEEVPDTCLIQYRFKTVGACCPINASVSECLFLHLVTEGLKFSTILCVKY